jgi:putative ABC transport system substrate-binding protein
MRRRVLLWSIAGLALAGPRSARAQGQPSLPTIVQLRSDATWPAALKESFLKGLHDNGLEEGRDYRLVVRSTGGDPARQAGVIADVVTLNPAVVVATTTGLVVALSKATSTIPIIGSAFSDPVGLGLAQSVAHPGGNVTGIMSTSASIAKLVEVLREIVPEATRIGVLNNLNNDAHVRGFPKVEAELAAMSITLVGANATVRKEIEPAFQTLVSAGVKAMFVGQDPLFNQEAKLIADLALAARLPLAYGFRLMAEAGGLLSYGTSQKDHAQRSGSYAAKILKGEKPGDLPIEQNAKVKLVINMKTAKALGLTIPAIVLARADELIE